VFKWRLMELQIFSHNALLRMIRRANIPGYATHLQRVNLYMAT